MASPHHLRPKGGEWELITNKDGAALDLAREAPIQIGVLCTNCQQIKRWIENNDTSVNKNGEHDYYRGEHGLYDDTYKRSFDHGPGTYLEASSDSGCHLCTLVWCALVAEVSDNLSTSTPEDLVRRSASITLEIHPLEVRQALQEAYGRFSISLRAHAPEGVVYRWPIRVFKVGQSLVNRFISTASPSLVELARQWIHECVTNHPDCRSGMHDGLPGRLLNLSTKDPNVVKVVSTENMDRPVEYAALSYCWGGHASFQLTSSTFAALTRGVHVEKLPKTIHDFILFAAALGIEWLWVDSLCIMQDSTSDWNTEAAKMAAVYSNSLLTIAAASAKSSDQGIFVARDPLRIFQCPLVTTSCGDILAVEPRFNSDSHDWPLRLRGWVFQERLLSRRTLHFHAMLSWECGRGTRDEAEPDLIDDGRHSIQWSDFNRTFTEPSLSRDQKKIEKLHGKTYEMWRDFVSDYTSLSFTVDTDRLMALEGVVSRIRQITQWNYHQGLWIHSRFMTMELLWITWTNTEKETVKRLPGFPSWSWTSTNKKIWHGPRFFDTADYELLAVAQRESIMNKYPTALLITCVPILVPTADSVINSWARGIGAHRHGDDGPLTIDHDCDCDCDAVSLSTSYWKGKDEWWRDVTDSPQRPLLIMPIRIHIDHMHAIAIIKSTNQPECFERIAYMSLAAHDSQRIGRFRRESKAGIYKGHDQRTIEERQGWERLTSVLKDESRKRTFTLI